MARRVLSDAENERQKQHLRALLHRGRFVFETYPQIEKIEITYSRSHNSFAGANPENNKECTWVVTPQQEDVFLLDCLNHECTSIGFNLGSVISIAIKNQKMKYQTKWDVKGKKLLTIQNSLVTAS